MLLRKLVQHGLAHCPADEIRRRHHDGGSQKVDRDRGGLREHNAVCGVMNTGVQQEVHTFQRKQALHDQYGLRFTFGLVAQDILYRQTTAVFKEQDQKADPGRAQHAAPEPLPLAVYLAFHYDSRYLLMVTRKSSFVLGGV